jgi:hypothetical protein
MLRVDRAVVSLVKPEVWLAAVDRAVTNEIKKVVGLSTGIAEGR